MSITQDKLEKISRMCLMDDIFWEVAAKDKALCQEVLQVILGDDHLEVLESKVQVTLKSIYGRSVRIDTLCRLGSGAVCNIEIQKSDIDNHLRRVRYHAACVTTNITDTGIHFEKVPDVYIVYISKFDIFGKGCSLYHVDKIVREAGEVADDGQYEYYANTAANDGSRVSELMECFLQPEVNNPRFPNTSKRVKEIKEMQEGRKAMSDIMEELTREAEIKAGIETTIKDSIRYKAPREETIGYLMEDYNLSREEAEEAYDSRVNFYLSKYN